MRASKLALLIVGVFPCAATCAAGAADARPKGTALVGTVTARRGSYAVVALAKDAKAQPGEQLLVGRPTLLVAVAKGTKRLEAWGNWQEAGRIKLRGPATPRCHLAVVLRDNPLTGPAGERAPNIRPGDIVYRPGK